MKRKKLLKKFSRFRKHPFAWPIIAFNLLVIVAGCLFVVIGTKTVGPNDSHIVLLSIDGRKQTLPTRSQTVSELLPHLKADLLPEDIIEPTPDTPISGDNFRVNIYHAKPVTIVDAIKKTPVLSAYKEPREIVQKSGVEIFPEDTLEIKRSDKPLTDGVVGQEVVINRSIPLIINLYGVPLSIRTQSKSVAEVIKNKNVTLDAGDTLLPAGDTPLSAGMVVFVVHIGKQIVTVDEPIPPPIETVDDSSLTIGSTSVRQEGRAGKRISTFELRLENGKEVGRKVIQQVVVTEPVKKIIVRGTQTVNLAGSKGDWVAAAGISQGDYSYVDYIIGRESGWCPLKWQGQVGFCPTFYQELHSTSSGYGYGLCQSTPANKMASSGGDWATNPVTQLRWCSGYAHSRYGSWGAAYSHWLAYHSW